MNSYEYFIFREFQHLYAGLCIFVIHASYKAIRIG
jgi:hypothetical protein